MNELHDDSKLVAGQLGHTVHVKQNVWKRASAARRKTAVDAQENALPVERRFSATEAEITGMKESIAGKKQLVRPWRKAIAVVNPKPAGQKKKAAAQAS